MELNGSKVAVIPEKDAMSQIERMSGIRWNGRALKPSATNS